MKIRIALGIVISAFTINSYAGCSTLQGVTLCDNGDRKLRMSDRIYTLKGDKLTIEQVQECEVGEFENGLAFILSCPGNRSYELIYGLTPNMLSELGIYTGDR